MLILELFTLLFTINTERINSQLLHEKAITCVDPGGGGMEGINDKHTD